MIKSKPTIMNLITKILNIRLKRKTVRGGVNFRIHLNVVSKLKDFGSGEIFIKKIKVR